MIENAFLESPGNFAGPKSNIKIKILRIKAWVVDNILLSQLTVLSRRE